jgi:hypothetical protein|uniref:Uncharacterized protein n=1 Tax=Zea mays TaxID=4577 RepID=C0PJP5_MAIZE|nr:unknown [Zea mays]
MEHDAGGAEGEDADQGEACGHGRTAGRGRAGTRPARESKGGRWTWRAGSQAPASWRPGGRSAGEVGRRHGTGDWRGRMRTQGLHGAQMPGRAAREEDGAEDAGLEEQGGARRPWEAGARA